MYSHQNLLRAARFEHPEIIPMHFGITPSCWNHYPQDALKELMAAHPLLFPDFQLSSEPIVPRYAPWRRAGKPYVDSWGCVWETNEDGFTGAVKVPSLADWETLDAFIPPDPETQNGWGSADWDAIARSLDGDHLKSGALRHGHTFLTLSYMRGYENLILDMADDDPNFHRLLGMVEEFNMAIVERYISLGVEWMGYPEDLGMQRGPMLSPKQFRRYIKPTYRRLVAPAREAGCVVHMHSDGDIRTLADDLIDVGIEVLNLQDLVNGIDWIAANLAGRVCVDLDIDRQSITRFGTPAQIDALIREAVEKLGSPEGGLMMRHGFLPGVPLENAEALMTAMERYAGYYS